MRTVPGAKLVASQQSINYSCVAEEAGATYGLLLTKPDEPMDRRQRRIKQLMEDMPAVLKAAEEAEAAAAAAAKASQTELPSPEKVILVPKLTLVPSHTSRCNLRQHRMCMQAFLQCDALTPLLFNAPEVRWKRRRRLHTPSS